MVRQYRTFCLVAALVSCAQTVAVAADAAKPDRHVVLIVWDGMRPDFVTEENTPALWKLAKAGVVFRNHHATYPSSTEVNGVAMATGVYPGRNGIIANHEYRPEIDSRKAIDTENSRVIQKGDELSGGNYVAVPTITELVRKAGRHTAIAAAKGIGLLQDRHVDQNGLTLFGGQSFSSTALAPMVAGLGPFPSARAAADRDAWTTKALTDFLWRDQVPAFSLLWLSEPDDTEHKTAPGSKEAIAAMKASDTNLGRVLAALDRHQATSTTDIFVVSDHGFSTIERSVDLRKILKDAGFDAVTEFAAEPKPGQIMLVGNGGTVLFYVMKHDPAITSRLVETLQQSDFAGVIFTKTPMDGTFGCEQAGIAGEQVPDVVMSFRWNERKNQFGVPGMIDADWQRRAGKGTHATLGRFDMHNTLIAAGPDFQRGQADDLPSGNVDLAPTILRILGIALPRQLDGRILSEAMSGSSLGQLKAETTTIDAGREFPSGKWRQTLKISRVGSTTYLDEGSGSFVPH